MDTRQAARTELKKIASKIINNTNDLVGLERLVLQAQNTIDGFRRIASSPSLASLDNVHAECGYPKLGEFTVADYKRLHEEDGLFARVNSVWPEETWQREPEVLETSKVVDSPFEKAWKDLVKAHNIYHYLERADILSGVGSFGVVLLGLDDGKKLNEPVEGYGSEHTDETPKRKLLFLRVFDESLVTITKICTDETSSRLGLPEEYCIKILAAPVSNSSSLQVASSSSYTVHWHRILHLADNRTTSEIFGVPRCQRVLKCLLDIIKTEGASAQSVWNGGFPGISLETDPDIAGGTVDVEDTKKQVELYMSKLQRFLALDGVHAKSLAQQVVPPQDFIDTYLTLLCLILNVPKRIFMGSEMGELASSQDRGNWDRRVDKRAIRYATPCILRPLINALISLDILPVPADGIDSYDTVWPDINSPSDNDKATTAEKYVKIMALYIESGLQEFMAPASFMERYLHLEVEEIEVILKELEEYQSKDGSEDDVESTLPIDTANTEEETPPEDDTMGDEEGNVAQ